MAKDKKTGGRAQGTPNKVSAQQKEFFKDFLHDNEEVFTEKFNALQGKDYVDCYIKLAEFTTPKMRSVENKIEIDSANSVLDSLRAMQGTDG